MDAIKRILSFLSTLWGALAAATIAFPGATAFLKFPIAVKNSTISGLYPVIGTVVSAFITLFLIAYKNELAELRFARKLAVYGMALGLLFFFAFVSVRVFVLDVYWQENIPGPNQGSMTSVTKEMGIIMTDVRQGDKLVRGGRRGDPFDVLGLVLFAGTFASLTFGFTALGINAYQQNKP